jgi:hypothetical protein
MFIPTLNQTTFFIQQKHRFRSSLTTTQSTKFVPSPVLLLLTPSGPPPRPPPWPAAPPAAQCPPCSGWRCPTPASPRAPPVLPPPKKTRERRELVKRMERERHKGSPCFTRRRPCPPDGPRTPLCPHTPFSKPTTPNPRTWLAMERVSAAWPLGISLRAFWEFSRM